MQRILRVGQYLYQLTYDEDGETPQIEGVEAATDLLLFKGTVPVLYKRLECIQIEDAASLTIDIEGKFTLLDALLTALTKAPHYGQARALA